MNARLAVRVQPLARREGLLGRTPDGVWKLAVTAPPLEGRANEAVEALVAGLVSVRQRQVSIARGASSRDKWVDIEGLTQAEAEARLASHLADDQAPRKGSA